MSVQKSSGDIMSLEEGIPDRSNSGGFDRDEAHRFSLVRNDQSDEMFGRENEGGDGDAQAKTKYQTRFE